MDEQRGYAQVNGTRLYYTCNMEDPDRFSETVLSFLRSV